MNHKKSGTKRPQIFSPMATGNGAYVIHRLLEENITNYRLVGYNPYQTFFPPLLFKHTFGINKTNTDLIHTTPDYGVFHYKKDIPLILTLHNFVLDRFMYQYSSALQNIHYNTDLRLFTSLALKKATKITAVSKYTAQIVKDFFDIDKEIDVIHNGVNHGIFIPTLRYRSKQKKIKVLLAGNLTIRKGINFLPGIIKNLDKNISVYCTGGLRKQTPKNIDLSKVTMLGNIPYNDMPSLYPEFDILLMPTVREGLPLAVMEAMACGLPVVASNCSSLPELIDNDKGGYLCRLGDTNNFAAKINQLASSITLRKEMGQYNRSKIESNFNLQDMITNYKLLFNQVMDNNNKSL